MRQTRPLHDWLPCGISTITVHREGRLYFSPYGLVIGLSTPHGVAAEMLKARPAADLELDDIWPYSDRDKGLSLPKMPGVSGDYTSPARRSASWPSRFALRVRCDSSKSAFAGRDLQASTRL